MLEEALSSSTCSPAEAALAFISFLEVELVAGGAAAESRFFKLFSMLCDRVFGKLSDKEGFRHEIGGWLSRPIKWERPNMGMSAQSPRMPSSPGYRMGGAASSQGSVRLDPVIKLLGARAITNLANKDQQHPLTLLEAFAKEAEHRPNVRYPFPFEALPKSTQEAWLALIESALGGTPASDIPTSENSAKLLGSVFRVKPLDQQSLRQYQRGKAQKKDNRRPLQLSPMHFQNPPMSPMATGGFTPTKEKDSKPQITLSMLEYFLLVFIRYPLAPPPSQQTPQQRSIRSPGVVIPTRRTEPYGDTVYYQLYQEYVNYYVPYVAPKGQSGGFAPLQRPSELFVRTTAELWLESQNRLATTQKAIKAFQDRRGLHSSLDLNASFDLVKTKYEPPSSQISRCVHKLVARAVSDGAIVDTTRDVHAGYRGATPETMCLTPTLTILQLPVYNHIRNAFRHATLHSRQSPFYTALDDWLVWLEPWNVRHEKGSKASAQMIMNSVSRTHTEPRGPSSRMQYPKGTHRSLYTAHWEPYIASNLYLYVVPLAIFLRRARELDFSPREQKRSLNIVRRVFRVFTPEVVAVINKLLLKEPDTKYARIVARHELNLGPYVPPVVEKGLKSCQDDMQNLLEEMYLQHLKKIDQLDFVDRSIAYIESLFGTGADAGEEKELRTVFEKAKVIVGFPKDHEIVPTASRAALDSQARSMDASTDQDRLSNGFFSASGLAKAEAGITKCNPMEIGYVGDRMLSRPQSHEIALLVPILVSISKLLNARLGLDPATDDGLGEEESLLPRRFNLRFLADYRNLAFMTIFYFLWGIFRG